MAPEIDETMSGGLRIEGVVERRVGQRETDVDPRAGFGRHRTAVKIPTVDGGVEFTSLSLARPFHGGQSALVLDPLENQTRQINGKCGRRVVAGILLHLDTVIENAGRERIGVTAEVLAQNDDGQSRRADVFLGAGVEKPIAGNIKGTGEKIRCHIRGGGKLYAVCGFVGGDMAVCGIRPETPFRLRRNLRETAGFSTGGNFNPAITAGFGDGAARPIAGLHIIRAGIRGCPQSGEVQGHQRQLRHGAAMHE